MLRQVHAGTSIPLAIGEVFTSPWDANVLITERLVDYLHPGDEPGLGIALDEELAAQHPYERAYLPVAQLRDGTVHDW